MLEALIARLRRDRAPVVRPKDAAPSPDTVAPGLTEEPPAPVPWVDLIGALGRRSGLLRGSHDDVAGVLHPGFPVGPDDVVADIGCGEGGMAQFCARQGAAVILADIDPVSLEATRARLEVVAPGRITALQTDSNPIPLADGVASRVICTEVIEHVDTPEGLLRELFRIARPGAALLLSCPDPRSEQIQLSVAAPVYFEKPNHVRIIPAADLERMVCAAGFVIERRDTIDFFWSVWWGMFWFADVDLGHPHPLLDGWARTWLAVLDLPDGANIQRALDDALPKTQVLVARRPLQDAVGDHEA